MNNILLKSALAIGGIASASGIGYGIYSNIPSAEKTITYANELSGTLLNTENNRDQTNWTARLASLKSAKDGTLVDELNTIKQKTERATNNELIQWCKDNISKPSTDKNSKEFKNIQSYCTFSVKEKIGNSVSETEQETSAKWKKGYDALKLITNESELDAELKSAKTKDETEGKKDIKAWCTKAYQSPYKGDNDQEFKNAKKLCVDTN